jgi:cellulose synthase/poly-beta-1,6-N-acetylglucosamine synthase-like glycosyltransferase
MLIFFYLTALFLLVYGLMIEYARRAWNEIPAGPRPEQGSERQPIRVTVLVPARNEQLHIVTCLRALSSQDYPPECLQIIVINDHSTDQTQSLVASFPYPHLLLLNLQDLLIPASGGLPAHKKKAIEFGVAQATGELIITTDADCTAPPTWIPTLVRAYQHWGAQGIAAPVKLADRAGLLSIFQSLDFIALQGITGASVYRHKLTMCNGANLAYTKQAFRAVDGFAGIDRIASGDDMLLLHKIAKRFGRQVFFLKSRDALVSTQPMDNWASFLQQRIRWASKADSYGDRRIFWVLLGVYLLNAMLLVFGIGSFFSLGWLGHFALLMVAKTAFEYRFMAQVATFFGQQKLMRYFPFLEPLHMLYIVVVGLLGKFSSYEWKGRRLN